MLTLHVKHSFTANEYVGIKAKL